MIQIGDHEYPEPKFKLGDRVWFRLSQAYFAARPAPRIPQMAVVTAVNLLATTSERYRVWVEGGNPNGHLANEDQLWPLGAVDQLGELGRTSMETGRTTS